MTGELQVVMVKYTLDDVHKLFIDEVKVSKRLFIMQPKSQLS